MTGKKKKKTLVPLEIIDLQEEGYHPLVHITVFGKPFILVLDTGASKTAFDQSMVKAEGREFILSDRLSTGLGTNSMSSSTAIIHDLYIGSLLIEEFEVAVLDLGAINIAYSQLGHPEVLGVLGGELLMKYKAVIDYGKKQLVLKV
jgi:predicted aspartyl protease